MNKIIAIVVFVGVLIVVQALNINPLLRYDMDAIIAGEYWRVISSSFSHLNWMHLALNITGLVLTLALFWQEAMMRWWLEVLLLTLFITCLSMVVHGDTVIYSGLSAPLHGLLYTFAVRSFHTHISKLVLIALVVKLVYEQFFQPEQVSELIGAPVYYDGHLFGVIAAIWLHILTRWLGPKTRKNRLGNADSHSNYNS